MDIISHYSTYTPARTATAGRNTVNQPIVRGMSSDEFMELMKSQGVKAPDRSKFLYNGSETRAHLSDTEIAVLANKYDPHDMDQETYDAFLDDLQSMGAISEIEKQQMGYHGLQMVAYMGEDGNWVWCGSPSGVWTLPDDYVESNECIFTPWGADVDFLKWLDGRTREELVGIFEPSTWEQGQAYENLLKGVLKIANRMQARRDEDAKAAEKAELLRQLADPNSDFYAGIIRKMQAQVKKNEEDGEAQDIVEALGAVLDALSGKKDVSGEKASVNKAASELTQKIGDRIARLRRKNPDDPEIVKLESMLKRLQEMGIYFDIGDTDDVFTDEEDNFETLTQLLTRRQKEEAISSAPQ